MDELIHHCLKELAYDGDYGCRVTRLRDFVNEFYTTYASGPPQRLDDAYIAFVWSLLVQQPSVRVGKAPAGQSSDVYVPPQPRGGKTKKGEDDAQASEPRADLVVIDDPCLTSLPELIQRYGDDVRVTVSAEACFVAITGSHVRPSKLTPMVYACLQIISRTREKGVTLTDLGKATGYDQKTCFYLVKQLLSLDLIVKLRCGGQSQNFCIHKDFYTRSPFWKEVRDEEADIQAASTSKSGAETPVSADQVAAVPQEIRFEPLDLRHLTSLAVLRSRVIKLLQCSKNQMHYSANIAISLGFTPTSRKERRFFLTRLRELIKEGLIEKVLVPSASDRRAKQFVSCYRLVDKKRENDDAIVQPLEEVDEDEEDEEELDNAAPGLKFNVTLQKQIVNAVEASGSAGLTLNELSTQLVDFDKRTLELQLTRAEKANVIPHLADLHIVQVMETFGRERRVRMFTKAGYQALLASQNQIDQAEVITDAAGGFMQFMGDEFFETHEEFVRAQDNFYGGKRKGKGKIGRPPGKSKGKGKKRVRLEVEEGEEDAEGEVEAEVESSTRAKKRARIEEPVADGEPGVSPPEPKNRGRPPKRKADAAPEATAGEDASTSSAAQEQPQPKKRGRPPRKKPETEAAAENAVELEGAAGPSKPASKPRGRRKSSRLNEASETLGAAQEAATSATVDDPSAGVELNAGAAEENEDIGGAGPALITSSAPITSAGVRSASEGLAPEQSSAVPQAASTNGASGEAQSKVDTSGSKDSEGVIQAPTETPNIDPDLMDVDQPVPSTSSKKPTVQASRRSKTVKERQNLTLSRRENEMVRVIEQSGGIANTSSKEFYDMYTAVLEAMHKAGEPISMPPTGRMDRRTQNATIESLAKQGRLKRLTTSATGLGGLGGVRQVKVLWLPTIVQANVDEYLANLGRLTVIPQFEQGLKAIEEPVEFSTTKDFKRVVMDSRIADAVESVDETGKGGQGGVPAELNTDVAAQRARDAFLTDKHTASQLFGFIPGKMIRARELHFSVIRSLFAEEDSPHCVSREHRIINISFFWNEWSLSTYLSIIFTYKYDKELEEHLHRPGGRQTRIKDLPKSLQETLQVAKRRAYSRLLDLLAILKILRIVTPLQPSASPNSLIHCEIDVSGGHPTNFEEVPFEASKSYVLTDTPRYWKFNKVAPVHLWSLAVDPRLAKHMPIDTVPQCEAYWNELKLVGRDKSHASQATLQDGTVLNVDSEGGRGIYSMITSGTAWNADYVLSDDQCRYLRQFIDKSTGNSPLQQGETGARQLRRLCFATCAPVDMVTLFFEKERRKVQREIEYAKNKAERLRREEEAKQAESVNSAEEATMKVAKEREWDELVKSVYPQELFKAAQSRLKRLRTDFVGGTAKEPEQWKTDILDAIKVSRTTDPKKLFPHTGRATAKKLPAGQAGPSRRPDKTVAEIVRNQNKAVEAEIVNEESGKGKGTQRRHRITWDPSYDELARDASVIIRARCSSQARLDWGSLSQVFPAIPRNGVRQRIAHLRTLPGAESYLKRLEEAWMELWVKHRGTSELRDDDPSDAANFPLMEHVQFLRKYIDKNAIRLGSSKDAPFTLPTRVENLEDWNVVEPPQRTTEMDFMWGIAGDEAREKNLLRMPLTCGDLFIPLSTTIGNSDALAIAEAALKMALGTPNERYDADRASLLLHDVGDGIVATATAGLLERNVLSKLVRFPNRAVAGRTLKISEPNQNSLGGPVNREIFSDAWQLESEYAQSSRDGGNTHEWPLISTDGETAALIQLVSDHSVDFEFDLNHARKMRPSLDWNSKKADDDDMEITYKIASQNSDAPALMTGSVLGPFLPRPSVDPQIVVLDQHSHCCVFGAPPGVVDCPACLDHSLAGIRARAESAADKQLLGALLGAMDSAGEAGMQSNTLLSLFGENQRVRTQNLIQLCTQAHPPLLHWVGYSSPLLVAAKHTKSWTVLTASPQVSFMAAAIPGTYSRVFPRRWLDINGMPMTDVWNAAHRAITGTVHGHPGITYRELAWRLSSVLDRMELAELSETLLAHGRIVFRKSNGGKELDVMDCAAAQNTGAEKETHLFIPPGVKWYAVSDS